MAAIVAAMLFVTFFISGLAKVITPASTIQAFFPALPLWLWPWVCAWELASSLLFLIGMTNIALCMVGVLLGGVFYAVFFLEGRDGITLLGNSCGLGAMPGLLCMRWTCVLFEHHRLGQAVLWINLLAGVGIGIAACKMNRKPKIRFAI